MKRFINKHLSAFLVLILLSTSVLSANHVHDLDHYDLFNHHESEQVEQCLAYHVADHQKNCTVNTFSFGEKLLYQHSSLTAQLLSKHEFNTPPARAPPIDA